MERQSHQRGTAPPPGQPDGLSALLETERELGALLARADEEAARIVGEARERGQALASERQSRLAEELAALDAREEAATVVALDAAATEAAQQVARLDSVPDEWIAAMADAVLADFLGTTPLGGAA